MSATNCNSAPERHPAKRSRVVLLVEDEILIRFALADYLRERGLKVYEAGSGEEAIQLVSFYKTEIDVVFSDVKMPGTVDGFDLAVWMRLHRPGVPVILTSGDVGASEAQLRALGLFFSKPYNLNAVFAEIEAAIDARPPENKA